MRLKFDCRQLFIRCIRKSIDNHSFLEVFDKITAVPCFGRGRLPQIDFIVFGDYLFALGRYRLGIETVNRKLYFWIDLLSGEIIKKHLTFPLAFTRLALFFLFEILVADRQYLPASWRKGIGR